MKKLDREKPLRLKDLTPEQVLFVRAMSRGMKPCDAYRAAGYDGDFANQGARKMLRTIQKKAPQILEELGLTQRVFFEKYFLPMLDAQEVKLFYDKDKGIVKSEPLPALEIQQRQQDMFNKIMGNYQHDEDAQQKMPTQILVVIKDLSREEKQIGVEVN